MPAPRAHVAPPLGLLGWWPLTEVATTDSEWYADHVSAGWWDPGDLPRTCLRLASALVDELLASLPAGAVVRGGSVVELGCGPGATVQELLLRTGARVTAYDGDPVMADAVRTVAPEATLRHELPLDLPDGSVDVVWVPVAFARGDADWAELLAEAHRLLRPGGHLVALHCGPGVWAWEREDPWDEETTGLLVSQVAEQLSTGGPFSYVSSWWLREHWGRGFSLVAHRRAGAVMVGTDRGHGVSSWRRDDGAALDADDFAAVDAAEPREAVAWQRQVELWAEEIDQQSALRRAALAEARQRLALLTAADVVEVHPGVRALRATVESLRAEVQEIRSSTWWRAGDAWNTVRDRLPRRTPARASDRGGDR